MRYRKLIEYERLTDLQQLPGFVRRGRAGDAENNDRKPRLEHHLPPRHRFYHGVLGNRVRECAREAGIGVL